MQNRARPVWCAGLGLLAVMWGGGIAHAAHVTLRVKGGGLEVSGELRSFDGATYVIEAPSVGTMTFDATRFECLGENCTRRISVTALPAERLSTEAPDRFQISGSVPVNRNLLPSLIRGYAASLGATTTQIVGTAAGEMRFRIADPSGAELATIAVKSDDGVTEVAALEASGSAIGTAVKAEVATDALPAAGAAAIPAGQVQPANAYTIGHDGLAVIVSPDNSAAALSEDALARIFSGQVALWTELGLPGGRIAIYSAGQKSTAGEVLADLLLKPRQIAPAAPAKELASEAEVADAVARDPNGIAVVSFANQRSARRVNLEGSCGLITRPTAFAVKAGEYPLSRKVMFYTGGVLNQPAARGLLRYALSRDAQARIAQAEFIDDRIDSLAFEDQTERMAYALNVPSQGFDMNEMRKLLADLKGARRLSLTFRFMSGAFDLATASRLDVMRLAELMQTPEMSGKAVMLIGFTDGEGKYGPNAAISARRANQVRTAVLAAADGKIDPESIVAKGYGPLAPIACQDAPERRQLNRRVEVWVRAR